MKISQFDADRWRFKFDTGMVLIVRKGILFRNDMLNPDLIIGDDEFIELNEFFTLPVILTLNTGLTLKADVERIRDASKAAEYIIP